MKYKRLVAFAVLLLIVVPGRGETPSDGVDQSTQSLPPGVLKRLGQDQMMTRGLVLSMEYAPDGKRVFICSEEKDVCKVACLDIDKRKEIWAREFPANPGVSSVHPSNDGSVLAMVSGGNAILMVETDTGKDIKTLTRRVRWMAFLPEDKHIVTFDYKNIVVFNIETNTELFKVQGVSGVSVSGDGKKLGLVQYSKLARGQSKIVIIDSLTGKELSVVETTESHLHKISISKQGKLAVVASHTRARQIYVYDTKEGKKLQTLNCKNGSVKTVKIFGNGKYVSSWVYKKKVMVWNTLTGKEFLKVNVKGEFRVGQCISPDGKTLAVVGSRGDVELWDLSTGLRQISQEYHRGPVNVLKFAGNTRNLITGGSDGSIRLWDLADIEADTHGKILCRREGPIFDLAISNGGKRVATTDGSNQIVLTSLAGDQKEIALEVKASAGSLFWSPDCQSLYVALKGNSLSQWGSLDTATPVEKALRNAGSTISDARIESMWGAAVRGNKLNLIDIGLESSSRIDIESRSSYSAGRGRTIAISPLGQVVAVVCKTGIMIVELSSGKVVQHLKAPEKVIYSALKFYGDGRMLAAAGSGGNISIWDLAKSERLASFSITATPKTRVSIKDIAFSADGKLLAAGVDNSFVTICDVAKYMSPSALAVPKGLISDPWAALTVDNPVEVFRSHWLLSFGGDNIVSALKNHLSPARKVTQDEIKQLIEDLGGQKYSQRERAYAALAEQGPAATKAIKEALDNDQTPEVQTRLEKLLKSPNNALLNTKDSLGAVRAVGVLERIGTDSAIKILNNLATGNPQARLTKEAKGALARTTINEQ